MSQTMNVMVYEIFQSINDLIKTDKSKGIELMRNNRSRVLIEGYLKMNYDPEIVFHVPAGEAPYKKQVDVPDGYCLTDLKQEFRRMRIFTDGTMNLSRVRREQLWLQMCEGLFWKEASLINKIKDRRITDLYDQLTVDVVREAYPELLPEVVAAPVPDELLVPVDFGDDPSKISEAELIAQGIKEFKEELVIDATLSFEDWKKAFYIEAPGLRIALSAIHSVDVDAEIDRLAKHEYAAYQQKANAAKKEKAGVKTPVTPSATVEKRKPGRPPKPKSTEPVVKRKPGRPPKVKA